MNMVGVLVMGGVVRQKLYDRRTFMIKIPSFLTNGKGVI